MQVLKRNLSHALLIVSVLFLVLAGITRQTLVFASPPSQSPGGKPGSRAPNSTAPAFALDLYERTQNCAGCGAPTENPPAVTLPNPVGGGYVIILENASGSVANQASWSDVLAFLPCTSATTVQLISEGGNFPSVATVQGCGNTTIVETQFGTGNDDDDVTTYASGDNCNASNCYRIHSAAPFILRTRPKEVPEADTLFLISGGLCGLATWVGWKFRKRRADK